MLHQIEDEFGQVWYVGKGDPCHKLVQTLHTRYYTWVVLLRDLITGAIPSASKFELELIKRCLRSARQIGYNSQGGRRHIRLAECLRILGG